MTNETLETGGYKLVFIDPVSGIDIVREATPEEIVEIEAERALQIAEKQARISVVPTVAEKLASVGLSLEELRTALGSN
jgi:hypothetical protein